jgi:hypothetical protein
VSPVRRPRLRTHVHVDGQVWGPGDEPPADVAARITNPKAWEDGVVPDLSAGPAVGGPGTGVPDAPEGADGPQAGQQQRRRQGSNR